MGRALDLFSKGLARADLSTLIEHAVRGSRPAPAGDWACCSSGAELAEYISRLPERMRGHILADIEAYRLYGRMKLVRGG